MAERLIMVPKTGFPSQRARPVVREASRSQKIGMATLPRYSTRVQKSMPSTRTEASSKA